MELLSKSSSLKWIKFLAIVLLVLGLICRFTNLDLRPYWYDETYTSLELSGYDDPEITQQIKGHLTSTQDLQKYQYPALDKSVNDTVQLIAKKEPQLTPLYFMLTRFWVQLFGDSVAVTRSFSAVVGMLSLFCVYWFSRELFKVKTTAWIAVALVAVSPLHVLYSQEARPIALWGLTILLSHIALLRAIRLQTPVSWILYALSSVAALYTYLFSILVLVGQGIYLLIIERFRITKIVIAFAISLTLSVISFIPWLMVLLPNISKANQGNVPSIIKAPFLYAIRWVRNIGLLFADFNVGEESSKLILILYSVILVVLAGLVAYALYFLYRTTEKAVWLFLLTAIAVPFLVLMLKDLLSAGGSSLVGRYLVPSWLGVQIAVAHLFSSSIDPPTPSRRPWEKVFFFVVLSLGVLSCLMMTRSELWWNKAEANLDRQLANQIINPAKSPLLVSDAYSAFLLSMSHSLNPHVRFLLVPENSIPELPANNNYQLFLYRPSQTVLNNLKQKYQLKPVAVQNPYTPGGDINERRLFRIIR